MPCISCGPPSIGTDNGVSIEPFSRYCALNYTSLTFQGHVTSSVTCSFDSPSVISYCWFFSLEPN